MKFISLKVRTEKGMKRDENQRRLFLKTETKITAKKKQQKNE
jgi:hypothetical protein